SPEMVSSENANGLAPDLATLRWTVLTPVRGTLALRVRVPSAFEVRVSWCRGAPLAAFANRRSSSGLGGSFNALACRGPQPPPGQHGRRERGEPEPTTHLPSFR